MLSKRLSVPSYASFRREDGYVWCVSTCKGSDMKYYLLYSFWHKKEGYDAWVTHSKILCAVSDSPLGPFTGTGLALDGAGKGWDADVTHNPCVIEENGIYYMYYMGTRKGDGWWGYRNNQRIGVAYASHPQGPWMRFDEPCIDVSLDSWDCLMTSNPSVTKGADGRFYMMYKGVGQGKMPQGGAVSVGMAVADSPLGPWHKYKNNPVFANPNNPWTMEDPCIWYQGNRFWGLIKDFQGYFTGGEPGAVGLFESPDGFNWSFSESSVHISLELLWENGEKQRLKRLERPNIFFEQGNPVKIDFACLTEDDVSFCVHIPLS